MTTLTYVPRRSVWQSVTTIFNSAADTLVIVAEGTSNVAAGTFRVLEGATAIAELTVADKKADVEFGIEQSEAERAAQRAQWQALLTAA